MESTPENPQSSAFRPTLRETIAVLGLLTASLIFNLLTATRYPFVWIDEVMYADPAVNLYLGHGWTSSAWYAQTSTEFWAGNVPLPPFLLFLWMKLFGFSILAIRSFNFVCIAACCWLLWRACLRLRLIATAGMRVVFLCLFLGGYSVAFAYRSARPDCLAMLVICLFLYAYGSARNWQALVGFFLIGIIAPWVGLQLMPMLGAGGLLILFYVGRPFLSRLLAAWAGAGAGGLALAGFYASHKVLDQFLKSIHQHTGVGLLQAIRSGHFKHNNVIPKDFSFWPLYFLGLLLLFWLTRQGTFRWRSLLGFGLVYSLGFSVVLLVSGKFPTYYGWMTYLPLGLCVCGTLASAQLTAARVWISRFVLTFVIVLGFGLHCVTAAYDWSDRDYAGVEKLMAESINSSEGVYVDWAGYYAAKPRAGRLFMPYYLSIIPRPDALSIKALVVYPSSLPLVTKALGTNWVETGQGFIPKRPPLFGNEWRMGFLGMPDYQLKVYRRPGQFNHTPPP